MLENALTTGPVTRAIKAVRTEPEPPRRGFLRRLTKLPLIGGVSPELARLIDEYDAALARLHAAIAEVNGDRNLVQRHRHPGPAARAVGSLPTFEVTTSEPGRASRPVGSSGQVVHC